jgi:hypothetical protein
MRTGQPTNGSPVSTSQRNSQAAQHRQIRLLRRAADERSAQVRYAEAEPMYLRALALAELLHMEDEAVHGPP